MKYFLLNIQKIIIIELLVQINKIVPIMTDDYTLLQI